MHTKKTITITLFTTIASLNSSALMAADDSASSFLPPIWPLLALVIIMIVFRKQLNCVPPFEPDTEVEKLTETTVTSDAGDTIDLKDNLKQCQASTAKGSRCKRVTTLEDTNISINGKTYSLTVCKQHNKADLKPFSELIK